MPSARNSSAMRRATAGGTRSSTEPPKVAISFTPLELRKLCSGDAIMNTVSMSGASFLFSWAMANSYSKSEMARSPLRMTLASQRRANSTTSSLKRSTYTLG